MFARISRPGGCTPAAPLFSLFPLSAAACRRVFRAAQVRVARWLVGAGLTLAVAACGGGEDAAQTEHAQGTPAAVHVTLDGDSVLFGVELGRSPAQMLEQAGLIVSNKTAVGLRLQDLLTGYAQPFLNAAPHYYPNGAQPAYALVPRASDVVVLQAGTNDALGLLPVEDYAALMRQAIDILHAEGRAVVLTGIVPVDLRNQFVSAPVIAQVQAFNHVQRQLALQYGLVHAGWDTAYEGPQDTMDGIHLTQAASDRLSLLLAEAVRQAAQQPR